MVHMSNHQCQIVSRLQAGQDVEQTDGIHPTADPHDNGVTQADHAMLKHRPLDPLAQFLSRHVTNPP
jgi:hypothetical protein